ncbi:hypothetical protein [Actinoallomurus acanthiterrae]
MSNEICGAPQAMLVAQEYGSDYCLSARTYLGVNRDGLSAAEAARARAGESDDPVSAAALAFAAALLSAPAGP